VDTAPAESGTTAEPSAPGVPTTRATTAPKADKTDLPGVPGSPITYDATNLAGQHPGRVRRVIGERLAPKLPPHCRANLCGITFAISTEEGDEKCFKRAAPQTVYPGGVITLFVGVECDQPERDEPVPGEPEPEEPEPGEPAPDEPAPDEPAPDEPEPGEPAPGERARPTTTTETTAGDGG
jgi:hypothetical protein